MAVPMDYSQRVALLKAQAQATATYTTLMQQLSPPAPLQKQAAPERPSPTWRRILTEAQVKFHTGLASSMPEALGQVAKEQPALYEAYRQEQLAACGAPVAKAQPKARAPAPMPPGILTEANGQPVAFDKQVAYWKAHPEERRAYERHFGRKG